MADDATIADNEARIQAVFTARQEATQATYERALQAKGLRDEIVKEHDLNEGEWVLVRHEDPQKFEAKWFGPYQIAERKTLGMYHLHNPNGKELQALVHGNRLLKAHLNSYDTLSKLWASPATKDALRRTNKRIEIVNSDVNGMALLERLLLDDPLQSAIEQVPVNEDTIIVEPLRPIKQDRARDLQHKRKRQHLDHEDLYCSKRQHQISHPMRQSTRQ